MREIDVLAMLRSELLSYKQRRRDSGPDDLVFTTEAGTARDKENVRSKVLAPVVKRADEILAGRDLQPLPAGISPHKLRHSFGSILAAMGEPMPSVMQQIGHTDPASTLRVYAHAMRRGEDERARLKALVEGVHWAPMDTHSDPVPLRQPEQEAA
jgi:integrase